MSAFYRDAALDAARADLGRTAKRSLRKLWLAVHRFETPDNDNPDVIAEDSPLLRSPLFWLGEVFPFALLGALVLWRRRPETRVLTVYLALYLAGLSVFFVLGRFRTPLVPAITLLAVGGGAWLVGELRQKTRAGIAAGLAVALGIFVCTWEPDWMADARVRGRAIAFNNLGSTLLAEGDEDGAIAELELAAAASESTVIGALRTLGDLRLRRHEYAEAERWMLAVLEHRPGSQRGRAALIRLYQSMMLDPDACSDGTARDCLAAAYRRQGLEADAARVASGPACGSAPAGGRDDSRRARARPLRPAALRGRDRRACGRGARRPVRREPALHARQLHRALLVARADGDVLGRRGRDGPEAADEPLLRGGRARAAGQERRRDRGPRARARGRSGARDEPGAVGKILEDEGQLEEALVHYQEALLIHPEFPDAHESAARVLEAFHRGDEAAEERRLAAASDPSSPRRFLYWGRYLVGKERYAAAVAELEHAVEAMPDDEEARALLDRARRGAR